MDSPSTPSIAQRDQRDEADCAEPSEKLTAASPRPACLSYSSSSSGTEQDQEQSSSSSSDDDEHQGAMRRLRSSVAHVTRSRPQDGVATRGKESSKSRSGSREPDPIQDQTHLTDPEQDRDQPRLPNLDQTSEREETRQDRDSFISKSRERSRSGDCERRSVKSTEAKRKRHRRDRDRSQRSTSRERKSYLGRFRRGRDERDRHGDYYNRSGGNWEPEFDPRRRERSSSPVDQKPTAGDEPPVKKKKENFDPILTRTGGAYIPPAKLRLMQQQITDKSSLAYQRMSWEALKKSINGLINKVNVSNIVNIIQELLQENIVRGRGLLARSVLQAQAASPIFTHVYSAVVAIINSKFPQIGELILKRLILNFRKSYRRNLKQQCLTASKFVAHLINQNVAHEVLCLEMLTLLLERPTDDSVEVAIAFLKECGLKLTEVSPRGINAIFERLRNVLHESAIDKRVQYMIEVMFAIRKDGFKDHPVISEGLDLVDEDDQFTHMMPLEDEYNPEDVLNVFKLDPDFQENEEKYKILKRDILEEGSSDSGDEAEGSDEDEDDEENEEGEDAEGEKVTIFDQTEVNLVAFRRTIYLAIQSSLDFEECAHKLIKMDFPDSQTKELCNMILDCCAQQRTYEKFFGLLAGRFCLLKKDYMESFEAIFAEQYETIHRLETNKLRNVARLFAHLLYTDSVPWSVLECVKMSEETTTSSSRIFVKILFQELCAFMGLPKLNQRLKDPTLQPFFEGLFPRDNPRNTRFAINFFTSIGLGGLTDELREHLKNAPKMIMTQNQEVESSDSDSSSSSDSSSDSSSHSASSSDDSSSSSSSDSDEKHKKKKSQTKKKVKKDQLKKEDRAAHTNKIKQRNEQRKRVERRDKREDHITRHNLEPEDRWCSGKEDDNSKGAKSQKDERSKHGNMEDTRERGRKRDREREDTREKERKGDRETDPKGREHKGVRETEDTRERGSTRCRETENARERERKRDRVTEDAREREQKGDRETEDTRERERKRDRGTEDIRERERERNKENRERNKDDRRRR
ncbi:hypothetical protein WMY93_002245 [Mugilogobius chulae]|uniref:Pre-mRNA-splicing factor CWC22 homolog n=1 Tax=Mugilogobius chulae TaxID=88201 RepID=A0AAW0PW10_9GOBI